MSRIILFLLLFISSNSQAQTKGFEFLSSSKSSLESIIKTYSSSIPDTSPVYKKYYLPLAMNYNKAKASYDGYRGAMKDCILGSNSKRKIQQCLKAKIISIKSQLDTLSNILNEAYLEAYSNKTIKENDPKYNGKNTGTITGDSIKLIVETLVAGGLKVWDQIQKYRKEYKDNYLAQISNKEYDLLEFDQLLHQAISAPLKRN